MNLATLRAELDDELTWRLDEIRFFRNQLSFCGDGAEKDRFRRAMVVMLYANFEGLWRAVFAIYLKAVNERQIRCSDAAESLVAAAYSSVFEALSDNNRRADFFRQKAPDDAKLHRFCRQTEFVGRIKEFSEQTVSIEPDSVVDTESNLQPLVMRKNLYRLGLDHEMFKPHEGTVHRLVNTRNDIAHGGKRSGITSEDYESLENSVLIVMKSIVLSIYDALREGRYLRPVKPGTTVAMSS